MSLELVLVLVLIGSLLFDGLLYWFWSRADRWSFGLTFFEDKKEGGLATPQTPEEIRRRILMQLGTNFSLCPGQLGCNLRLRTQIIIDQLEKLAEKGKVELENDLHTENKAFQSWRLKL